MFGYCGRFRRRNAKTGQLVSTSIVRDVSTLLHMMSRNALFFLPFALPANAVTIALRTVEHASIRFVGYGRQPQGVAKVLLALLLVLVVLGLAAVGIVAIVLKMAEVSFVGQTQAENWSTSQWILMVNFLNNIISLTNYDRPVLKTSQNVLHAQFKAAPSDTMTTEERLLVLLWEKHGWKGFCWYMRLKGEEMGKILYGQRTERMMM
jgi:hypothetical protein